MSVHNDIILEWLATIHNMCNASMVRTFFFMSIRFLMIDSILFCYLVDQIGDKYSVTVHL